MDKPTFVADLATSPEREALNRKLDARHTPPVWRVLNSLVTPEPQTACVPAHWRYSEIRPLLMEAGRIVTAAEAERVALVLENPGLPGRSQVTQSLYAGLQLVQPGDVAPGHRHTAAALRFVVEGNGAYTSVDGERVAMYPGDFVLTPPWTFHDHGNPTDVPMVWLDGIDLPIVNMFDTSFAEHDEHGGRDRPAGTTPPSVFAWPYARSRENLLQLSRDGNPHPCHGFTMEYLDPATGRSPMTCVSAFLQSLPAGFRGRAYRSTDATVFCAAEGSGRTRVGDVLFDWAPHDVFVVPSWHTASHEVDEPAVLFSFSDRAAQRALGLWREEMGH